MALDRELRRLLEYARLPETDNASSKDGNPPRPTARGILDRIIGIHRQTCVPSMGVSADMNLPELLVLTAEAAIFQGDFDTASESVEWFFSECQLKNQVRTSITESCRALESILTTRWLLVVCSFTAERNSFARSAGLTTLSRIRE